MTIRNRLVIQFLVLASFILGLAFVAVYLRSADFRQDQFRNRLRERGEVTVNLLIDVEEVDDRLLRRIDANNPLRVPEESITIFSDDSILFHLGEDHGDDPVELLPLSKEDGTVAGEVGEREVLGYKVNTGKGPVMVISSGYDRYGRTKLSDLRRMMVITFLLGMGLIVILGRVFASQALAPVKNLIREIQHIRAAGLSARVDTGNGKDELAQLANAFNLLLKRLETVFKLQKDFIANASHEMHTPLTAISGQIDVVLLKPRSVPEYAETLRSVQDDLRAVNRLSLRLLLLARAEAETLSSQFVPVRVDELIWAARTEVLRNGAYSVSVELQEVEDEAELMVNGNEVLLLSMIGNLLDNACKYSPGQHAIISLKSLNGRVELSVEDNGVGIPEEDQTHIFENFYRAKSVRKIAGHGIGLALVKRIAEIHGATVTLRSQVGTGSTFVVSLPKNGSGVV